MNLENLLARARLAGLQGRPLPDFGAPLPKDVMQMVNTTYDSARNQHAANKRS